MMKTILFVLFLIPSLILNAQISSQNLLAYYPFDGNLLDAGPNGLDGTGYGNTFGEDAQGNPNSALILDGVDDLIDLSVFSNLFRQNLNRMTIIFKVRFVKQATNQTIISLGNTGDNLETNVFEFEYENSRVQIETETGNAAINHEVVLDPSGASLITGGWHRVMIVLDGDNVTYCRDGIVIYDGSYTPSQTLSDDLFIGCFAGLTPVAERFFGGYIDDLQFYDNIFEEEDREFVCTPCVDLATDLVVDQDFEFGEKSFQNASNDITSTSTINIGASVTFRAGNSVTLEPGFTASFGGLFETYLVDCIDTTGSGAPANRIVQNLPQTNQLDTTYLHNTPANLEKENSLTVAPNPFSANATVGFNLKQASSVTIRVTNLNGAIMETLSNGLRYESGSHQLDFDAKDLPNGIYLLQMITETDMSVVQLVLSK